MPSFASGAHNPLIYRRTGRSRSCGAAAPDVSWMLLYPLAGLGTFVLARHWCVAGGASSWTRVHDHAESRGERAHGHGSQMVNEAYLPWVLWLTSRLWRYGRWSDAATLALLIGFQLLRGHVQIAYYGWLAIGLYSLFEFVRRIGAPQGAPLVAGRILRLGVAVGLGLALSAFFVLPIREYAQHSIRAAGAGGGVSFDYATGWSFSPVETLTFPCRGRSGSATRRAGGTMQFGLPEL
jgi:hypothetical protein